MSTALEPAVVIVGAGPVGLVAACDLARRGVSIRIFDKLAAPPPSRAPSRSTRAAATCWTGWAYSTTSPPLA